MSRYALFPRHDHSDKVARWLRSAGSLLLVLPFLMVTPPSAVALALASTAISTPPSTASSASPASSADTTAGAAASADETLFLEVDINGQPIGKIGEFIVHRGKLMARVEELRDLGLRVPESRGPHDVIPLSDIPGLTYTLDGKNQQVHITVSESRLVPTQLEPLGRARNDDRRTIESGTGATMNYDVVDTIAGGQTGATGAIDLRGFSPLGVVSSGWLAYAGGDSNGSNKNTAIRLDSSFTYADINTLRRYSLGDFITGGLAWTRPVRLSGAQIRSDFSMRPDLVTFPLPSVKGSAAVPSTVNILADHRKRDQCAGPTGHHDSAFLRQLRAPLPGPADFRCAGRPGAPELGHRQQRIWKNGGYRRLSPRFDIEVHRRRRRRGHSGRNHGWRRRCVSGR
jgi:outer membrane usher protein FimD/PapC